MTKPAEPVLQDRGREALRILSQPGPVTVAEAIACAVLSGELWAPTMNKEEGA